MRPTQARLLFKLWLSTAQQHPRYKIWMSRETIDRQVAPLLAWLAAWADS
jgi:hypothetical protein